MNKLNPGKWVWFEHASSDPERAQAFFAEVLGWKNRAFPMGSGSYDMIFLGDTPDTMIGGYVAGEGRATWRSYSSVEDVDVTVAKATAAGAKVVEAPHSIPGVGRSARIVDPAGAELSLFTRANGDPADLPVAPEGGFFWVELHTPDAKAALDFYDKALGFTHTTMGDYHVIAKGGVDRGGVSDHLPEGGKPHWLPYVHVSDVDATAARSKQHGGKVLVGPEDIPTIGRFAIIADPTGAMLAVMKPMPRAK